MIRKFYETTYARIEVRATVSMDTTLTNLRSLSTDSRSDHEVIVPFKHNHCQAFLFSDKMWFIEERKYCGVWCVAFIFLWKLCNDHCSLNIERLPKLSVLKYFPERCRRQMMLAGSRRSNYHMAWWKQTCMASMFTSACACPAYSQFSNISRCL